MPKAFNHDKLWRHVMTHWPSAPVTNTLTWHPFTSQEGKNAPLIDALAEGLHLPLGYILRIFRSENPIRAIGFVGYQGRKPVTWVGILSLANHAQHEYLFGIAGAFTHELHRKKGFTSSGLQCVNSAFQESIKTFPFKFPYYRVTLSAEERFLSLARTNLSSPILERNNLTGWNQELERVFFSRTTVQSLATSTS